MNLEYLWLWGNPISDLSPLTNLTALTRIDLAGCQISNISPLANLTQLTYINLRSNRIVDISALANLNQLTKLRLNGNSIVDVSPLANLTLLEQLEIHDNSIVDIQPLANLIRLTDLTLAGNAIRDFRPLFELDNLNNVDIDIRMLQEVASVEVEIPDPNLERAIRNELALADDPSLTQADMLQLTRLEARDSEIKNLAGLEYAANLTGVTLPYNEISDLTPLAELMNLEYLWLWGNPISDLSPLANLTALTRINLAGCQISNISPLSRLTQLTYINLRGNNIVDISALTNLNQLTKLRLNSNRIVDVSPLANLIKLEWLEINENLIEDHSPLETLNLTRFVYDQVFELPRPPIQPRIENRTFPSVFSAWGGVLNKPDLSDGQRIALHDFYWSPSFGMHWRKTDESIQFVGGLNTAQQQRDELVALNPNMLFIREIRIRDAFVNNFYPEDWPHWIRDKNGNLIPGSRDRNYYLIDFTHPELQEQIVEQAIAAARCGLFDGIFFDWWNEDWRVLKGYRTYEEEQRARDSILQRIRAAVKPDFLIIGNGNRRKFPRTAPYINGTFMETLRDYDGGYTHDGLAEIESTLLWAEKNLREPQINCLEGWGVFTESPDSLRNRKWMRVFTTMSLTHSDGYVLYNTGGGHGHYWYDFWDANLGKPIGPKAQLYQNVEGLFIREFTNGWAVYNRSGQAQTITLRESATPVSDRGNNAASLTHTLPDLDGEIYLTTRSFADVNGDGQVNILDLIQVANSFGKSAPDPNGDGVVNILDLVFVASTSVNNNASCHLFP